MRGRPGTETGTGSGSAGRATLVCLKLAGLFRAPRRPTSGRSEFGRTSFRVAVWGRHRLKKLRASISPTQSCARLAQSRTEAAGRVKVVGNEWVEQYPAGPPRTRRYPASLRLRGRAPVPLERKGGRGCRKGRSPTVSRTSCGRAPHRPLSMPQTALFRLSIGHYCNDCPVPQTVCGALVCRVMSQSGGIVGCGV